jgi:superfamily II RNA helicase
MPRAAAGPSFSMARTLSDFLPRQERPTNELLLERFLEYVEERGLELYAAQEEAILELYSGHNVLLRTPTGSGKSLVALALQFKALAQGKRSVYTCPIKALVNEKWRALCEEFGSPNVGLSTGDATVNRGAPVLCCTAEILANIALREGADARLDDVIMDEFHWYSDRERGVAWQAPLFTLPQARFLLMSATLGDMAFFERELTRRNGLRTVTVSSDERPVPLEFTYAETPLARTVEQLVAEDRAPVYVVHFTQLDAAQSAQDFTSLNVCTREEKKALAAALEGFRFTSPYGPKIRTWLKHGIGLHHAGLLPKYRVLVETLAQQGRLKIICGTDTLGVGVNVPIRTVLFTRLCKYDGEKTAILSARDFHQIAGRAGRKGFDDRGWVVAQAPEHVIENLQLARKAAAKGKKFVRRKPPERNFVNWDEKTFRRLINAPPEPLTSSFQVSHGMLLNVLSRAGDGCRAMRQLLRDCHDSPARKRAHRRRAWQLFRSLLARGVIEFLLRDEGGSHLRVNVDLQEDFSMNQTLSLYLLDTLPKLDPEAPDYALDVLTLVESILEDPDLILRKQLDRVKAEALAAMKAEGMDYEQRMAELEKLEHPKPKRDFIYGTFNAFAEAHAWVGTENIRPKSIAREMFETFRSFDDYVRDYELQRAEGLLLRHLNSVYKVLAQTVPDPAKTEEVWEMELYLRDLLQEVDSSLLEEWERMRQAEAAAETASDRAPEEADRPAAPVRPLAPPDITADRRRFTAAVRQRVFAFLRAWSQGDHAIAARLADGPGAPPPDTEPWTEARLREALEAFQVEHGPLRFDPEARNLRHTRVEPAEDGRTWRLEQMLIDEEGLNDWVAVVSVDLPASRQAEEPVWRLDRLGPLA